MKHIQSNLYYFSKNACLLCCLAYMINIPILDVIKDFDALYNNSIITKRWEILNVDKFLTFYNKSYLQIKIGTLNDAMQNKYAHFFIQCKRYENYYHYLIIDKDMKECYNSTEYCKANNLGTVDEENYIWLEKL